MTNDAIDAASFRDPSGRIFRHEGRVYRQVNRRWAAEYDQLMSSGLYERLTRKGLLIPHREVDPPSATDADHYRTLLPEQLAFVSHPYEWSFSQLHDAALLTLRIQQEALAVGMTLKDASAYNVQFHRGRLVFIDTLSFAPYLEGEPWIAYRQFCQHFLAPLALMSRRDVRLLQLLRVHIDGIPLDLAVSLLPVRSWLRPGLLMHLRIHARYQRRYQDAGGEGDRSVRRRALSNSAFTNLIRDLEGTVKALHWRPEGTEWADYTSGDSYDSQALEHKKATVARMLRALAPGTVWDLGANTGLYSRIASELGAQVMSFDGDPACVERNYRAVRERKDQNVLPLLLDLVNPSPGIGWANRERASLAERGRPDVVLALALIHHIAISNNVPLAWISDHFADLAESLVIEFVPKGDAKVQTLLATREDIFPDYHREGFEAAFRRRWKLEEAVDIEGSERTLYLMRRSSV